jgi:hypothetical protein
MECCFVARNGCCALWNLSYLNLENGKAICRFKGVGAVADANVRWSSAAPWVWFAACACVCGGQLGSYKARRGHQGSARGYEQPQRQ